MTTPPFKNIISISNPDTSHAMIDGIRRRFGKSINKDPWDANLELRPKVAEAAEIPTDTAVLMASRHEKGEYSPEDANTPDYYKGLVTNAIENGGRYGDHRISIPWLRMILAGLEFKHVEPEMMWYGVDAGTETGEPLPEIPSYENLFPSDRETIKA